jgi:hypothetical protein
MHGFTQYLCCYLQIIHGNESCVKHGVTFFLQAYKRALPVYVPVYLIPALIVHRQDLLKKQYSILGKGLLGTARSSLFLATYCSSAWLESILGRLLSIFVLFSLEVGT